MIHDLLQYVETIFDLDDRPLIDDLCRSGSFEGLKEI